MRGFLGGFVCFLLGFFSTEDKIVLKNIWSKHFWTLTDPIFPGAILYFNILVSFSQE